MSNGITSPAQADDLLKAIDDEIDGLRRKARGIRSQRNTLVPINRLPLELLAEIFYELVRLHDSNIRPSRYNAPRDRETQRWLVVTFVCRAWRTLALGTPRLWSHMLFNNNTERVELFLARSSTAALMANAWNVDRIPVIRALFGAMHRVQDLRLSETTLRVIPVVSEENPRGLDSRALRILTVDSTVPFPAADSIPALAAAAWPVLKTVALNGGSFSVLRALVRPTLTSLSVGRLTRQETGINAIAWITMLQNLPCLKNLRLDRAIPSQLARPLPKMPEKAVLPQLVSLDLTDDGKGVDSAFLLRHLDIPTTTLLDFEQGRAGDGEDNEYVAHAFAGQMCGISTQGSEHALIRSIEIGECGTKVSIRAFFDPLVFNNGTRDTTPNVSDAIPCHNIILAPTGLISELIVSHASIQSFPFSWFPEVRTLGTFQAKITRCETWRVLSQLTGVREVHVSNKPQALHAFLECMLSEDAFPALQRMVIGDSGDRFDEHGEQKRPEDVYVSSRLVQMLENVLRVRDQRGLKMKTLDLRLYTENDDDNDAKGPGPFRLSELKTWVDEFKYRGSERRTTTQRTFLGRMTPRSIRT